MRRTNQSYAGDWFSSLPWRISWGARGLVRRTMGAVVADLVLLGVGVAEDWGAWRGGGLLGLVAGDCGWPPPILLSRVLENPPIVHCPENGILPPPHLGTILTKPSCSARQIGWTKQIYVRDPTTLTIG